MQCYPMKRYSQLRHQDRENEYQSTTNLHAGLPMLTSFHSSYNNTGCIDLSELGTVQVDPQRSCVLVVLRLQDLLCDAYTCALL